jgi:hypothetical protein
MNRIDHSSVWIQANADCSHERRQLLRLRDEVAQLSLQVSTNGIEPQNLPPRQKLSERIGETCVSDQLFDSKVSDDACTDTVPERKYGIVHAIYLAAIGVATIGWLWLIAWCALQLI